MESKELALVAVGMIALSVICLMGIAVVTQYGESLRTTVSVRNESLTIASGAGNVVNDDLLSFTELINRTTGERIIYNNVSTDGRVNITLSTGAIVASIVDSTDYATYYTHKSDNAVSDNADNFKNGLIVFGTFAAVLAIALIGKLIIGLFKKGL